MDPETAPRRVELYVRSLSPEGTRSPVEGQLDRLRQVADADDDVELAVNVWGREIGLSSTAVRTRAGRFILDRVGEFRGWASREDRSLEPFFEAREVRSEVTGERYASLVLPVSCLAEYEAGGLVHVAPHVTGDALCSVADRIRHLEENADVERRSREPLAPSAGR